MADKAVNMRLPQDIVDYLGRNGESMTYGCTEAIYKIIKLEKYADRDIQKIFTNDEWCFMVDSLNGTLIEGDFRFLSSALIAGLEDSAMYDGMDKKWGVNMDEIKAKISNLSCSSVDAVYRRIEAFWNNPQQDLREWANY